MTKTSFEKNVCLIRSGGYIYIYEYRYKYKYKYIYIHTHIYIYIYRKRMREWPAAPQALGLTPLVNVRLGTTSGDPDSICIWRDLTKLLGTWVVCSEDLGISWGGLGGDIILLFWKQGLSRVIRSALIFFRSWQMVTRDSWSQDKWLHGTNGYTGHRLHGTKGYTGQMVTRDNWSQDKWLHGTNGYTGHR